MDDCRETAYFNQIYQDADKDICSCVNYIRDIVLNVVRDAYGMNQHETNRLSVESSERCDEVLKGFVRELVWISAKQQIDLAHELRLNPNFSKGQGSGNRATVPASTVVSLSSYTRDNVIETKAIG